MFAKIRITGDVELLTAMHIGGNAEYMGIGSVDSPVSYTHLDVYKRQCVHPLQSTGQICRFVCGNAA